MNYKKNIFSNMKNKSKIVFAVLFLVLLVAGNYLYRKYQIFDDAHKLSPEQLAEKYFNK